MKNLKTISLTTTLLTSLSFSLFAQNTNAFRFRINGNGYSDETIVRLVNGATENFDGNYDAWKLFSGNQNVPSIYTQIIAGQKLSINSLPEFTEDKSITLYTNIPANGTYTLDIEEVFALTPNYKISLTDITSTTHYQILGDTALVFTFNTQQNSPTFTFNISKSIITSVIDESCFAMNDGKIKVTNEGNTKWDILITDSTHTIVKNKTSLTTTATFNNLAPGAYIASVSSLGIVDEVAFTINAADQIVVDFDLSEDTVYITDGGLIDPISNPSNGQTVVWNFGDDGSSNVLDPLHNYTTAGVYNVVLLGTINGCTKSTTKIVTVLDSPNVTTGIESHEIDNINLITEGNGNYNISSTEFSNKHIQVYSLNGIAVHTNDFAETNYSFSLNDEAAGIYIVVIEDENGKIFKEKVVK